MKNLKSWLVLILVVFDFIKSRLNITEQFLSILALAIFGPNKLSTPLPSFSNSWCIVRHRSQLSHTACQIVGDNSSFRLWRRPKSWRIFFTVAADLGHLFMIGIVKWRLESHPTCVSLTYGFSLAPGTQHPTIQRNILPETCPTTTSNQTHQQLPDYVTQWYTPPKTNVKNRGYPKGWFGKKMAPFKYGHAWYLCQNFCGITSSLKKLPNVLFRARNQRGSTVRDDSTSSPAQVTGLVLLFLPWKVQNYESTQVCNLQTHEETSVLPWKFVLFCMFPIHSKKTIANSYHRAPKP